MLKAILFDLDMTLIDFMKMKSKASDAAAKAMVKAGLDMPVEKAKKRLFETYLEVGIESETVFQKFLKENNAYSERILAAAINAYLRTKYRHMKAYPDVAPTLKKIKEMGIKIAIVTDAPRLKAYQRLDIMGIADMFDAVVGFEDTGKTKPSTLPFEKALNILEVKPGEAMHVGDWPERDVLGARKLGIKTCLAKYGFHMGKYIKADYEINSFKELLEVVKNA